MTIRGKAFVVGAYEHPRRDIPDLSVAEIHAEVALAALADAGLAPSDVDAYFCDSDAPGVGPLSMSEYLGLRCRYLDTTETGGASYLSHVGHAAAAITAGKCRVALVVMGGRPRTLRLAAGPNLSGAPETDYETHWGITDTVHNYALAAMRHMHEFGTTSRQLAEVKVAASLHARHNPNAFLRKAVTVEDVLSSPMISDPLHRLDCCVMTDGGGAVVVASAEVARRLPRRSVAVLGHGEAAKGTGTGRPDLSHTAAVWSGPAAFAESGVTPGDVDYASIYDSFTITALMALEDLGFCEKGEGGRFVEDGALVAPHGRLPMNTDGGGLCNNQPDNRGGMARMIEAVRQLRGEAAPEVQVPDCRIAVVHGSGGRLATRSSAATLVLGREDA
ncbi:thiolase domain-containing protein [Actinomadura decatromicini]|uniref:Thiolase domain-containing protein n=1 Tax=Actinomadura decatromicini TaxID=2604572 RepID=A0A5D3FXC5_9ACTN|nr:thiolase domain-containing protein [Actinomadura decatromicini]TYK52659.1 thiolase domain-containing protein [Actinomadura decatromicini]